MPRKARIISLLLTTTLALPLFAGMPELSSIEPLEFDEQAQRLVARGDARLEFEKTRVRADRITYYQEYALADAVGAIAVTHEGSRLIADRLSYDTGKSIFSVENMRTGQWPFYISGVSAGGTQEDTQIRGATLYYGNPGPFALSVSSDALQYKKDSTESVSMDGATFRVGRAPVFYLPAYTYTMGDSPYYFDLSGGYDDELGAYFRTTTLFPVTPWLRMGANLDYYTERGPLAGPTAQYVYNDSTHSIVGALSTGAIEDRGERDVDVFNRPVDSERAFANWRHKHHIGERFTASARATYWSDSEVARDFREDTFYDNQRPDTFAEGVYAGDNFLLSAFGRFRPNDFQLVQERLPELRFDLLPVPIFTSGAYHKLSASYARLNEKFGQNEPLIAEVSRADRFDLSYRIERPFRLTEWLTLTPLAGGRLTQYQNQEIDPFALAPLGAVLPSDEFTREIYELGFDLEGRAYATYPTVNATWKIAGLRHLIRPVARYRYFSDPDSLNQIAAIDRQAFDLERPVLDLSDLRNVDTIAQTHLVRLGVENLYQTRAEGYGSRTLAALNFYQDVLFEKGTRYDGDKENTFNATWVELALSPAPWLKFDLASRFNTAQLTLEELRTRTSLKSGDTWELGLSTDLLNKKIDQYRLDFTYRFNQRYAFLSDFRFDADTGDFTQASVGLHTRFGSTWEVIYAITFREDARRESDYEFSVRLKLAQP